MDAKHRKAFSLALSVLIHAALAIALIKVGVRYALPEGTVSSDTTAIEVLGGNGGVQMQQPQAPDQPPAQNPAPRPEQPISAAQAKMEESLRKQVAEADAKLMPVKEPHDVVSDGVQSQTSDENTAEKPPTTESSNENQEPSPQTSTDSEQKTAVTVPAEATDETVQAQTQPKSPQATDVQQPPAEAPQPPTQEQPAQQAQTTEPPGAAQQNPATATSSTNAVNPGSNTNGAAAAAQGQAQPGGAPAYGTPGSMLDVQKLAERPGNRKPNYPWTARLRRQEGVVIIRAFIKPDGRVDMASIEKSSGFPALDDEAMRAYSTWRYEPGPSGWVIKPFKFALSGK